MIGGQRAAAALAAVALAASVPAGGCDFAVQHPPATFAIAGAAIGFTTCKLDSDDYAACGIIGASAAAGLGLVALVALWLGGDGHSVLVEDPPKPLPYDARPLRPSAPPPAAAAPVAPVDPAVAAPAPAPEAPAPAPPS